MEYGLNDHDLYTLSTGKTIYADRGIIGLSPYGWIYGGSDDRVYFYGDELTDDEVSEVATYMVEKWQALIKNVSRLDSR